MAGLGVLQLFLQFVDTCLGVIQSVFKQHGPLNEHWAHGEHRLTDINTREILVMAPLMILILFLGVWPMGLLDVINKAMVMLFH